MSKREQYTSGSGKVESYNKDKTKDHDEIVLRLKDGRRVVISNNTKLGVRVEPNEGDEVNYHGYGVKGTNVVHKVHPNKSSRGGWLEHVKKGEAMRDFTGLLKIAGIVKSAVNVPVPVMENIVRLGGRLLGSGISRKAGRVAVPGLQEYLTHSQFKRLMRQAASIRREQIATGASVARIMRGRDIAAQRAAKMARRSNSAVTRNLSALRNNGFERVGTTYSGFDIYDMPFSDKARLSLRGVIDAQYGVNRNPWCIITRTGSRTAPSGKNMGMFDGSLDEWRAMGKPASGRFRTAVDRSTGKIVAIENPSVGSADYPSWQSLSNNSFINIEDAAMHKGNDPVNWAKVKERALIGYEKAPNGSTYPVFNRGHRMNGERHPIEWWRSLDGIDDGTVDVL